MDGTQRERCSFDRTRATLLWETAAEKSHTSWNQAINTSDASPHTHGLRPIKQHGAVKWQNLCLHLSFIAHFERKIKTMKDAIIRAGKGRSLGSLFICTVSDLLLLSFLKKKNKKNKNDASFVVLRKLFMRYQRWNLGSFWHRWRLYDANMYTFLCFLHNNINTQNGFLCTGV